MARNIVQGQKRKRGKAWKYIATGALVELAYGPVESACTAPERENDNGHAT